MLRNEDAVLSQAERLERIRDRNLHDHDRDRHGLNRLRPGPGSSFYSPGMVGTVSPASRLVAAAREHLDREIEAIARALQERGPLDRDELKRLVGGQYWGPGQFAQALKAAVEEGRATRQSRTVIGPPPGDSHDEHGHNGAPGELP